MASIERAASARLPFHPADRAILRDEREGDVPALEALLDAALGRARVLKTCERLRAGRRPAERLALVACAGDRLVGTLRLWPVRAGGLPALLLGPLAVHMDWRRQGLGGRLIDVCLARAALAGHRAVLLVGDAAYYERFGFRHEPVRDLRMPGPVEAERFLGLELTPGALAGAVGLVVAPGDRLDRPAEDGRPSGGRERRAA